MYHKDTISSHNQVINNNPIEYNTARSQSDPPEIPATNPKANESKRTCNRNSSRGAIYRAIQRTLISTDPAIRLRTMSHSRNTAPRPLDIPSDSCDNDSIVIDLEVKMLVLECLAVLVTVAILITPAPEVE